MKSYTDLEQSKKLAKILPIESADMYYYKDYVHAIMSTYHPNIVIPSFGVRNMPNYEEGDVPCWSLAALLSVIKPTNENTYTIRGTLDGGATISFDEITNVMFQEKEIIDAVFEMVVWLKKIISYETT